MNLSMSGGGKYVEKQELSMIPTPSKTQTWTPVPHTEIVDTLYNALEAKNYSIINEQSGLARNGLQMFGVVEVTSSTNPEWHRCVGIRNSHDKSLSVGITAGIKVLVYSNLCFGGTTKITRKHSRGIYLDEIIQQALNSLENDFTTIKSTALNLKEISITQNDARANIVRASELGVIPSCDIIQVFNEYTTPRHADFNPPNLWSLLNAFTEIAKKYSPQRRERFDTRLTNFFGLNGNTPQLLTITA